MKKIIKNILLSEGRIEDAKKLYKNVPEQIFNSFINDDPSGNNKYLNWMLKQYNKYFMYSDIWLDRINRVTIKSSDIIEAVKLFHKYNNRITQDRVDSYFKSYIYTKKKYKRYK